MYYLFETNHLKKQQPCLTRLLNGTKGFNETAFLRCKEMLLRETPFRFETYTKGIVTEYLNSSVPLFRTDLLNAFSEGGANNFQCFASVIIHNGIDHINYHAINILEKIQEIHLNTTEVDVPKIGRFGSTMSDILVHNSIKAELDRQNFEYILWRRVVAFKDSRFVLD